MLSRSHLDQPQPYQRSWWADWKFIALLCALTLLGGCLAARADDVSEGQARAALALAKAKRERSAAPKATPDTPLACYTDLPQAKAAAAKANKPLVLWVGVQCADKPQLRKALAAAVHCHVKTRPGSERPEIIIEGDDGVIWSIEERRLDDGDANFIAAKILKAARPPTMEPRRGEVIEDLSRKPGCECGRDCDCKDGRKSLDCTCPACRCADVVKVATKARPQRTGVDPWPNGGFWIEPNTGTHPPVPDGWTLRTVDGVHYLTQDQVAKPEQRAACQRPARSVPSAIPFTQGTIVLGAANRSSSLTGQIQVGRIAIGAGVVASRGGIEGCSTGG